MILKADGLIAQLWRTIPDCTEKKEGGAAVVAGAGVGGVLYRPDDLYEQTPLPLVAESPRVPRERRDRERGSLGGGLLIGGGGGKTSDKLAARFADDEGGGAVVSFHDSRRPSAETVGSGDSEKEKGDRGEHSHVARRAPARRVRDRRRGSFFPGASFAAQGNLGPMGLPQQPLIPQVLQIPQLDAVQRTQKILDMRLQHLQLQTENINQTSGMGTVFRCSR